jgi:HlyD family secretion protein
VATTRKSRRRWLLVSVLVLVGTGVGVGFAVWPDGSAAASEYQTEVVDRGDVAMIVTATGTISAVTTVQVGSQVSGIIARLHADFNSRVQRGQLLAELDPTPFEAQVAQRRADLQQVEVQLKNAEIGLRRQERLRAEELAAAADYDAAVAAHDVAAAQVAQANAALQQSETNLRYTRILSPIDGIVVARQYDVGQTVAASFQAPTLFTIAQDLTKMQVQADVDQSDIGRISVGQTARFTVDAYPEQVFEGTIAQVRLNATVNQNVITYPVIIEVPNPDEKLRPNMTADVTVEVERVHDVLRVPNAALRFRPPDRAGDGSPRGRPGAVGNGGGAGAARGGDRGYAALAERFGDATEQPAGPRRQVVFRLGSGAALEPVPIRPGISDGRFTAVIDGPLAPGDRIVVGLATTRAQSGGPLPGGRGGRF